MTEHQPTGARTRLFGAHQVVEGRVRRTLAQGGEELPPGSSTVEIDLRADGDATILVLRHGSLPDEELPAQRMGWTHYLPRLAVAAAGGEPGHDPGP